MIGRAAGGGGDVVVIHVSVLAAADAFGVDGGDDLLCAHAAVGLDSLLLHLHGQHRAQIRTEKACERLIVHGVDHILHLLRGFAAGFENAVVSHLLGAVAGKACHRLRERGVERGVVRRGHILAVDACTVVHTQLVQIGLCRSDLLIGRGGRGVRERGAREHVHIRVCQLFLDDLGVVGVVDGIVSQSGGVADRAVGAAGHAALGRAHDADDLERHADIVAVVELTQTFARLADIRVARAAGDVALRGEDELEVAAAEVSIAPAFLRRVDLLFAHGLHHGVADVIHALEAERVERKVGDLVVFIHDEYDLVVILRP